jgi:hypothetical protein
VPFPALAPFHIPWSMLVFGLVLFDSGILVLNPMRSSYFDFWRAIPAGAIIGRAAVLCACDIWLKIEGYKN